MSEPKRLTPQQALDLLRKKWDAHHANWLVAPREESWPFIVILHDLTEKDVFPRLGSTREWVQAWRAWDPGGCSVEWASRKWSSGDQELPMRLVVSSADAAATVLGHRVAWDRVRRRYAQWCERFPKLAGSRAAARHCDDVLADFADEDFERLGYLLQWFLGNPRSGVYLRQLPVEDVDTKWVEKRRGAVTDLVRHLLDAPDTAGLHEVCGLRTEPARMRIRVLCPQLRTQLGGLCDIEAPSGELAVLPIRPRICIVVENQNTGIALPDIAGAVAFMRLGLAVDQLEAVGWIREASLQAYWGDLDTHGFTALARARRRFPAMVSVLMDENTLLSHRSMWVREDKPSKAESPESLTAAELAVYEDIRTNRWGHHVRLEQERISWPFVLEQLKAACCV
ncbi:Wadjet anti-phage system protein JetD domain-containing protein [Caenimonas soli]|uniref:Wadjet anti-phage system protein JetD domain-containing protein n=1 Tax=Caenimonas soli TaxID=2735555 RepID=UPI001553053D|nr:DUF3322 and DUF2220 domain-containing protein [Caenimonas soli]NPC56914.1 hypothetical protein [Caenimonas soli]